MVRLNGASRPIRTPSLRDDIDLASSMPTHGQLRSGHQLVNTKAQLELSIMASLFNNFTTRASNPSADDDRFDLISSLPKEVATQIFQLLDPTSMLAAMRVRRRWYSLYRSDKRIRQRLRAQIRRRDAKRGRIVRKKTKKTRARSATKKSSTTTSSFARGIRL